MYHTRILPSADWEFWGHFQPNPWTEWEDPKTRGKTGSLVGVFSLPIWKICGSQIGSIWHHHYHLYFSSFICAFFGWTKKRTQIFQTPSTLCTAASCWKLRNFNDRKEALIVCLSHFLRTFCLWLRRLPPSEIQWLVNQRPLIYPRTETRVSMRPYFWGWRCTLDWAVGWLAVKNLIEVQKSPEP